MTVNVRISMTTTSISMMRTTVVMSEGLRNGLKYMTVCFFLGYLKKTIDFHKSLPQESEFRNKCRHHWQIKFGLFFMSASCFLLVFSIAATTDLV